MSDLPRRSGQLTCLPVKKLLWRVPERTLRQIDTVELQHPLPEPNVKRLLRLRHFSDHAFDVLCLPISDEYGASIPYTLNPYLHPTKTHASSGFVMLFGACPCLHLLAEASNVVYPAFHYGCRKNDLFRHPRYPFLSAGRSYSARNLGSLSES